MAERVSQVGTAIQSSASGRMQRRTCLQGMMSGLALASPNSESVGKKPAAALAAGLSGAKLLEAYMRIRGRTDGKPAFGWLNATRSAVVEGDIVPLCGVIAGSVQRYERVSDNQFEATVLEVAHYTHPVSGVLLETLTMPVTGRTVKVPSYRFGPSKVRFAVALDEWEEFDPVTVANDATQFAPRSSVHLIRTIGPVMADGPMVQLRADEYGRVYPDRAKPPTVFYREWMIWRVLASLLADTSAPSVPAEFAYSALSGWRPWMQMAGVNGHTAENGFGRKVDRWSDCPAQFLELTRRLHPDVLDDPDRVLRGSAQS
jgi:hypothetical protein